MKFKHKIHDETVEAITFQELVQHGVAKGGNIVNGMPWSFNYQHFPITHENDECYIIPIRSSCTAKMTPDRLLVTNADSFLSVAEKDDFLAAYIPLPTTITFEDLQQQAINHNHAGGKLPFTFLGMPVTLHPDGSIHVAHPDGVKIMYRGEVLTYTPFVPPPASLPSYATKVQSEDITNVIEHTYFFTGDRATQGCPQHPSLNLITFCIIILKNGFTVTGTSTCAHPATFNAEIGRELAYENARNQIWPLLGYQLKDKLHQAGQGAS